MRARALARIAARRATEDTEAIYEQYIGVLYRTLLRKVAEAAKEKSHTGSEANAGVPAAELDVPAVRETPGPVAR